MPRRLICFDWQEDFDGLSALVSVMEWAEDKVLPHINSGGVEEEGKGQRKRSVTSSATKHDLCGQVLKVSCSSPSSMVVTPRQRGFFFLLSILFYFVFRAFYRCAVTVCWWDWELQNLCWNFPTSVEMLLMQVWFWLLCFKFLYLRPIVHVITFKHNSISFSSLSCCTPKDVFHMKVSKNKAFTNIQNFLPNFGYFYRWKISLFRWEVPPVVWHHFLFVPCDWVCRESGGGERWAELGGCRSRHRRPDVSSEEVSTDHRHRESGN